MIGAPNTQGQKYWVSIVQWASETSVSEDIADIFHNHNIDCFILSHIVSGLCYFLCPDLIISWICLETTPLIDSIHGLCCLQYAPIKFIKIYLVTLSRNVLMSVLAVFSPHPKCTFSVIFSIMFSVFMWVYLYILYLYCIMLVIVLHNGHSCNVFIKISDQVMVFFNIQF